MRNVDYIVVGLGIAGICFCEELSKHRKSFIAIHNGQEGATAKSGGVLNPTVLKRFNAAWNVAQFYPFAVSFYHALSLKLKIEIFQETPILKVFKNVEEQNNWSVASDKWELKKFLSSKFVKNDNPAINAEFGFGEVLRTARINTLSLLNGYQDYLWKEDRLMREEFQYEKLEINTNNVIYGDISARKVIFCEGSAAMDNPFFPSHIIIPNKGEYLTIRAPKLNLKKFLKGALYIIPLGNSLYKVGATFGRDDFSLEPTAKAQEEIISKLRTMIFCEFEIIEQSVGIRPTTRDRKPILGGVPENPRLAFLNGLGTRGFTMAPLLSHILFENVENGTRIPKEMDINRLTK